MRYLFLIVMVSVFLSCQTEKFEPRNFASVNSEIIFDGNSSIRAITIMDGTLAFAGSKGLYGMYDPVSKQFKSSVQVYDSLNLQFRAVAHTKTDFFMLSIESPALLFKTGDTGKMELVYKEENEKAFYDSMGFWNDMEGIAMGDPTEDCISIIITRDGGNTWTKVACDRLPQTAEGEIAFAASNTNLCIVGDKTWIITGGVKSRVFYSPNKGKDWEVFETPIMQGESTKGMYSVDFYDENTGFAIGGDYTKPELNKANKMVTHDGGKTWQLVADGQNPGYASCVQYIPRSEGMELVTVGPGGIYFSNDGGGNWKQISKEAYHTLKFIDRDHAFAAGNERIVRLTFSE